MDHTLICDYFIILNVIHFLGKTMSTKNIHRNVSNDRAFCEELSTGSCALLQGVNVFLSGVSHLISCLGEL